MVNEFRKVVAPTNFSVPFMRGIIRYDVADPRRIGTMEMAP